MKRSAWMEGLLFAESQGAQEAHELLVRNEFEQDDFDRGVRDYVHHMRRMREVNDEPQH